MSNPIGKSKRKPRRRRNKNNNTNSRLNNLGKAVEDSQKGIADLKQLVSFSQKTKYANDLGMQRTRRTGRTTYSNTNSAFFNTLDRKMMNDYCKQYFDYLLTLSHPWSVTNALIPDWTAFPRGTAQIRTIGVISTGSTATDDNFMLTILPCIRKSGFMVATPSTGVAAYITIDGVKYGPSQPSNVFSVHNLATWDDILDSYRIVSMGVRAKYMGQVLNTAGMLACGTLPPEAAPATNFDQLSDYNYSYVGPAANGVTQVWLPAGIQAFQMFDVGDTISSDDQSFIQIAGKGLPINSAVLEIEWVLNIEVYSTNQLLTANARAGKPDANKMSTATSAMASAHAAGKLNGSASSAKAIGKTVLRTGAKLAGPVISSAVAASDEGFLGMLSAGAEALLATLPEALIAL